MSIAAYDAWSIILCVKYNIFEFTEMYVRMIKRNDNILLLIINNYGFSFFRAYYLQKLT